MFKCKDDVDCSNIYFMKVGQNLTQKLQHHVVQINVHLLDIPLQQLA
jgi:hypothetical protein